MSTTTAATRNKIYRKALSYYRYHIKKYYNKAGLCYAMKTAIIKLKLDAPYPYYHIYEYPEVLMHKPESIDNSVSYWWDVNDTEIRINVLKDAIKKTDVVTMNPELNFNTDPIDSTS